MIERILQLIDKSKISNYALEKQLGFTQGTIGNWRRKKNKLSVDAVIKLARYFNVSADYLLCLTDEPKLLETTDIIERPNYALLTELAKLSQDERFVNSAKLYKAMPIEYRQQIYTYIFGIAVGLGLNVPNILGK